MVQLKEDNERLPLDIIVKRYIEEEISFQKLADEYSVSASYLWRLLSSIGISVRKPGAAPKKLPNADIIQKYEGGERLTDIAQEYGVTMQTILRHLAGAGVKLRGRGFNKNLPDEEIIERYKSGDTPKVLAQEYSVSEKTIRRRLSKQGTSVQKSE